MISQKSHSLKLFLWKNFFTLAAAFCATFLSVNFYSNEASALFVPTLSASIDQANLQVNGNSVINSTNKTTEIPLSLTVNTNNKTGYTATLNSETNETALVNSDSTSGTKINSISNDLSLNNLPNNTWGYKFGASTNYAPIPALSAPAQILQTAGKTNGNESNQLSIGMKLTENLESGDYQNKLILSFVSNPYQMRAIMTAGSNFNSKLKSLETATNKIEHFKKSTVVPVASLNAVNIEDKYSDYEIKLWLDPTDKTAYYYTEPEKVYLNRYSNSMFSDMSSLTSLDLSNFDTSSVTDMSYMFSGVSSLTSLDLSNFDTSEVAYMDWMFGRMSSLISLSNFNTSGASYMRDMFNGVSSLTSLNLSNFNTSNVEDMYGMFANMFSLTALDLSNFNTSNVKTMEYMFYLENQNFFRDQLEAIYVKNDFDTTELQDYSNMFMNRKKLRGGAGSYLANPSTADKTWLRVDRPGAQGYFTRKP